jgi:hypothetical protein
MLCGGLLLLLNLAISKNSKQNFKRATYPKMFCSTFLGGGVICLAGARSLLRPEKSSSCLSGGCAIVIMTGKKSSSRLSGGCAIVITTGNKKVLVVCLAGA